MLRTTAIAKELAVIERKLQETTNQTLKDALKKKQARLKDELNDFKKSTPALAKQLLAQRAQIKQLSKMDFNDLIRRLSKKPEYSFLRTMSKSTIKTDIERPAKPVGWRFKGRGNYDKPTIAEIKKGKRNGTVYREVRPLRSDVSQPLRLEHGGTIEIGDKVKASKEYGGKSGTVIDKRGSFVVVKYTNGESDSYHESDLVKKMENGGNMKNAHMMETGGGVENKKKITLHLDSLTDSTYFSSSYGTFRYGYNDVDVVVYMVNKEYGYAKMKGKFAVIDVEVKEIEGRALNKLIFNTKEEAVSYIKNRLTYEDDEFGQGGNMENTHMMEEGGVIGQEIVFDDSGEENRGVIKDIHETTGDYIVATDDGRTVLASKELDVISLGKMRKQEAKKRFSFFEDGGGVHGDAYRTVFTDEDGTDYRYFKDKQEALRDYDDVAGLDAKVSIQELIRGEYVTIEDNSETRKLTNPEYIELSDGQTTVSVEKYDGKWYEGDVITGEQPYGWGGKTYMGYLKPEQIASYLSMDYNSSFKVIDVHKNGGKMVRGGKTDSTEIFDLEYGDVFQVTKPNHDFNGAYFVYVDLEDSDESIYIEALLFPGLENQSVLMLDARLKNRGYYINIKDIQDGDIRILTKAEAGEMLMKYYIRKNKFEDGGNIKIGDYVTVKYPNETKAIKRKVTYIDKDNNGNVISYFFKDGSNASPKLLIHKMEDGGNIAKENNEMLHSQAKEAKHHIEELHEILTSKTKVEPWVVAKMTRAKTDLSDITHYLEGMPNKMAKGGKLTDEQQNKFDKVMHEWKEGKLHSGSANGPIVTDQDQAIAIAYSEAYGMDKMLFGGMVNDLSDDTIDRMEGLVPISTLGELLDNAKFIIVDMYEEGFEKDEIMSFLAYKISQIGSGKMMQSVSQVQQWTIEDENALTGWISDIQDGYGWITPGYVEDSWTSRPGSGTKEWNGDIQQRVYKRLIDENMLFVINPNDYEKKGKKIKDVTTAIWSAAEENGYEHGGKMQTGGGVDSTTKYKVGDKIKSFEVKKIVDGYAYKYDTNHKKTKYITQYLLLLSDNGQERILRADKNSLSDAEQYYATFGKKFKYKTWNMIESPSQMAKGGGVGKPIIVPKLSDIDHTRIIKWMSNQFDSNTWDIKKSGKGFEITINKLSKAEQEDLMTYLKSQEYIAKNYKVVRQFGEGGGVGSQKQDYIEVTNGDTILSLEKTNGVWEEVDVLQGVKPVNFGRNTYKGNLTQEALIKALNAEYGGGYKVAYVYMNLNGGKMQTGGGVVSVYNLRKGDKIKTRKGDIETIERKIESGYYTKESEYSHPFESIEFVERPNRKMANGGGVDGMSTVNEIARLSGLRAVAVADWGDKNNINLTTILKDLKAKKIKGMDLMTAVVGKPGNKYSTELIAKYSKMSKGGNASGWKHKHMA